MTDSKPHINCWAIREVWFDENGDPGMHREPQERPPVGHVIRRGRRADGKQWMEASFKQDGSIDLPDGTPLYTNTLRPPREQITAAAKALCREASTACNVDFDDNWKIYGDDYIADATAALNAAYGIREAP